MRSTTRISLVIPLYNKASYVLDALRSTMSQELAPEEVVVVDDGSTDDGPALVAGLLDPRIRLLRQTNAGVSVARNNGVLAARGDFVAFLDADDLHLPGYWTAIRQLIDANSGDSVFCTAYRRTAAGREPVLCTLAGASPGSTVRVRDLYGAWCRGSFTHASTVVVRRSALLSLQPMFPAGERLGEDQDLWFRLSERHDFLFLNTPMADYRTGVADSATGGGLVTEVLPCYQRLANRVISQQVPKHQRRSARRLVASHLINVARARFCEGRRAEAWALLMDRRAWTNVPYWTRTALGLLFGGHPVSRSHLA